MMWNYTLEALNCTKNLLKVKLFTRSLPVALVDLATLFVPNSLQWEDSTMRRTCIMALPRFMLMKKRL